MVTLILRKNYFLQPRPAELIVLNFKPLGLTTLCAQMPLKPPIS